MMRILFILPGEESGYTMIFAKRQIDSLKKLGIDSLSFYLASRLNPFTLLSEYRRFRKCIKSFNPDIIHSHYGTMTAFFAGFSSMKPFVITYYGSDLNFVRTENFFLEIFRKILSQVSALRASALICVSQRLKDKLWWRKKITAVVPIGVDENFFHLMDYNEVRKKLNIDANEKLILFYSNAPVKRLDIAQKAEAIVKNQVPSAKLKVLQGKVSPDEIVLLLNACDCFLLCSDSEGSPAMVKEAMACNLPVVSTDVGDVKQNIEATSPHVITEQNPQKLAAGIVEVLQANRRSNGREALVKLNLTEKKIAEKVMDIYREILKR